MRDWLGDPSKGLGRVGRSSERSGTGREVLPGVRDWSGTLPVVWDKWEGPSEVLRRVGRSFGRSGMG